MSVDMDGGASHVEMVNGSSTLDSSRGGDGGANWGLFQRLLHNVAPGLGARGREDARAGGPPAELPVGVQRADDSLMSNREDLLNELADAYFENDVDPLESELQDLGVDVASDELSRIAEEKSSILDAVGEKLSWQILQQYGTFKKGLDEITSIEHVVSAAKIHTKVSRERLASASGEVQKGIKVWKNAQKKKRLSAILDLLNRLHMANQELECIREELEAENYGMAVGRCANCAEIAASLFPSEIVAADVISDRANDLLCKVADQMYETLCSMTTSFDADRYEKLLQGYECLTDPERIVGAGTVHASEEIVAAYCSAPPQKVEKVVNGVLYSKFSANKPLDGIQQSRFRIGDDTNSQIPGEAARLCIGQALRVEFDIIKSYWDLERWHVARQSREEVGSRMSSLLQEITRKLSKGKNNLWNESTRAISSILQGSKLSEGETFLIISTWINTFAEIGFHFSGENPDLLNSVLSQQTIRFFHRYHANALEALHVMLERETYKHVCVQLPWFQVCNDGREAYDVMGEKKSMEEFMTAPNPWNDVEGTEMPFCMLHIVAILTLI